MDDGDDDGWWWMMSLGDGWWFWAMDDDFGWWWRLMMTINFTNVSPCSMTWSPNQLTVLTCSVFSSLVLVTSSSVCVSRSLSCNVFTSVGILLSDVLDVFLCLSVVEVDVAVLRIKQSIFIFLYTVTDTNYIILSVWRQNLREELTKFR